MKITKETAGAAMHQPHIKCTGPAGYRVRKHEMSTCPMVQNDRGGPLPCVFFVNTIK